MPSTRQPVSVVLTSAQLAWLDRFTQDGSLSRSAAIRLVLQRAMEQQRRPGLGRTQAQQPHPIAGQADAG